MTRALNMGLLIPDDDVPNVGEGLRFVAGAPFNTDWFPFAPIDSPSFTGVAVAPTPPALDSSNKIATTAFVMNAIVAGTGGVASFNSRTGAVILTYTDVNTVFPGSNAPPLMDGSVSPGVASAWSKADHVHPSDTSRLSLSGGTMTGPLVLSADPSGALGASTKQYTDNSISAAVNAAEATDIDCGTY